MRVLRLIFALRKSAKPALAALLHRQVPGRLKLIAVAVTLFIISPLNILGDVPLLGVVGDAALISVVFGWFTRASSPYINTYGARSLANP